MFISITSGIDWSSVLVGVGSSLIASLLFLLVLFQVRPRIIIGPSIAKLVRKSNGQTAFVFKVINRSPFFKAYDLRGEVIIYKKTPSRNGQDLMKTSEKVDIINGAHWSVSRFNVRHLTQILNKNKKIKGRSDYAIQIGTEYDLENVIEEERVVRFVVHAKHPLSGFTRVRFKDFDHIEDIQNGYFTSGFCFDIR